VDNLACKVNNIVIVYHYKTKTKIGGEYMFEFRTKEGQQKHDNAVAFYSSELAKNKYIVYVDLPNMKKPGMIGGFIPDVYAILGNNEIVVEVETVDSAQIEHALKQNYVFQQWENSGPLRKYFRKIV
jgi:hypothetical protein